MEGENHTLSEFIILGFSDLNDLQFLLFTIFLMMFSHSSDQVNNLTLEFQKADNKTNAIKALKFLGEKTLL